MASKPDKAIIAMVRRELMEYRLSFLWTPIILSVLLSVSMLSSVVAAKRTSALGDAMIQVFTQEQRASGLLIELPGDEPEEGAESASEERRYVIKREEGEADEDWEFDSEWQDRPERQADVEGEGDDNGGGGDMPTLQMSAGFEKYGLNPLFHALHGVFLLVLIVVSFVYLLGCLFNDRKERSILFYKSMPVTDWHEVLVKFVVALLVVPVVYIVFSQLTQLIMMLLSMWLVAKMELDPGATIVDNLSVGSLVFDQISGWLLTVLWIAPVYAWLMLASSAAKRSPFILAIAPPIAIVAIEKIFFGSSKIGWTLSQHFPHYNGINGDAMGFYPFGPDWSALMSPSLIGGLIFAAFFLSVSVYLRKYRFDI